MTMTTLEAVRRALISVCGSDAAAAREVLANSLHEMLLAYADAPQSTVPHCDARVLHAPMECEYCDAYPNRQRGRVVNRVEFTGHPTREGWCPCPSDVVRGLAGAHVWRGNVPKSAA